MKFGQDSVGCLLFLEAANRGLFGFAVVLFSFCLCWWRSLLCCHSDVSSAIDITIITEDEMNRDERPVVFAG